MLKACFVGLNPWIMISLAVLFTVVAIYFVLVSHQGEKRGTYLALGFVGITLFSLLLFTCWAFLVALLELILGFLMNQDKLRILMLGSGL